MHARIKIAICLISVFVLHFSGSAQNAKQTFDAKALLDKHLDAGLITKVISSTDSSINLHAL